jgi:hypothetical protein
MNKNIFCLITIIVIILLIDLVFNVSKPLFRVSEGFQTLDDDNKSMIITSVMGNIIRLAIEKEKVGSNKYYIPIFDDDDNVLGLDSNEELVILPKVDENLWTLREFGTDTRLVEIVTADKNIPDEDKEILNNRGGFILTKNINNKEYALFYNNNTLTRMLLEVAVPFNVVINIGTVSTESIPTKALVLRDFKKSYLGQLNYPSGVGESDKINIKLNLEDEKLKQLLNLNNTGDYTTTDSESEKCDTYLSRDAVKSLCPGCV